MTIVRELVQWSAPDDAPNCTCGCRGPRTAAVLFGAGEPVLTGCTWSMRLAVSNGLDALARLERTRAVRLIDQPEEWARRR